MNLCICDPYFCDDTIVTYQCNAIFDKCRTKVRVYIRNYSQTIQSSWSIFFFIWTSLRQIDILLYGKMRSNIISISKWRFRSLHALWSYTYRLLLQYPFQFCFRCFGIFFIPVFMRIKLIEMKWHWPKKNAFVNKC